jgi:tetratricopeptide (TPR) repeat protein
VREASGYAAVALFADRSQAAASLELNDRNVAAVSEICRRLDGIPLAIELAAARMKMLTPSQVAQMLDERFRILTGGDRTAMPRQQTMHSALDWSYDLLSEQERLLFDRLSVFVGGFTLELAGAVCATESIEVEQVLELLSSLVDKSLVIADLSGERTRFRLLESSRDYASESLVRRGEKDFIARRHAQVFLNLAEHLADSKPLGAPRDPKGFMEARHEQDNWSAALTWSLKDRHDAVLGQRLAAVVTRPGYMYRDQLPWLRTALAACDEKTPRELIASLELSMAYNNILADNWDASLACSRRAIAIYRELGQAKPLANAQMNLANALSRQGSVAEARELTQQALEWARNAGSHDELNTILSRALIVHWQCGGDLAGAQSLHAEGLQRCAESSAEPAFGLAALHSNMASIEAEVGEMDAAVRHRAASIGIQRQLGHPHLMHSIAAMAGYLVALERFSEARALALESVALLREAPDEQLLLETLHHLAAIAALRRRGDSSPLSEDRTGIAWLVGYVDARITTIGEGRSSWDLERQERDQTLSNLREVLGTSELAQLMVYGATMSEDRAVELALSI